MPRPPPVPTPSVSLRNVSNVLDWRNRQTDDLRHAERDDREVVGLKPEGRERREQPDDRGHQHPGDDTDREREPEAGRTERRVGDRTTIPIV